MLDMFNKQDSEKNSRRAENYFWKAMERLNEDKHDLAVKELQSAIQTEPDTALDLLEEQWADYYNESRTLEALTMGKVLFKHRPDNAQIANRLGNIHRKLGERKHANEFYKKAISLNKKDDTALHNLAASMANVPRYDDTVKKLLNTYIRSDAFLIPESTYPKDLTIINHLTEMLNMKQFFGKVERLQELILKKTLQKEEPDLEKLDTLIQRIKQKVSDQIKNERQHPNIIKLLREALKLDWQTIQSTERDRFLWNILNLGLFIFKKNSALDKESGVRLDPAFQPADLDLAIDCFFRLKAEEYSYRYLDMIIALSHTLSGNFKQAIDELKQLVKNDPNDRYLNINLGLLYRQEGNQLLSLIHLIKGAHVISELGGACHLIDILNKANEFYKRDEPKKALRLYRTAALETDSIDILSKIGDILIALHRYEEAIRPYKSILRLDPESRLAADKLKEIQEHFVFLADEFYDVGEYTKATEHFEKALEIDRSADLLKKTAKAYKLQGDHKREYSLNEESRSLQAEEASHEKEATRNKHLAAGKLAMKHENFQTAIEEFKEAFRIRMDKDVFMYLSYLYKKFNHKRALQDLVKQWNNPKKQAGSD